MDCFGIISEGYQRTSVSGVSISHLAFWQAICLLAALCQHYLCCQDKTKPSNRQLACCVSRLQQNLSKWQIERARAFVLEETSLAADKESCLGLLYSLLQNWDDTVSGSFSSYIIVSVCFFYTDTYIVDKDHILWPGNGQHTLNIQTQ